MTFGVDNEKLIKAYDHMVEQVHEAINQAEEAMAPSIEEMVNNAQKMTHDLYELSQEESHKIAEVLKRDLHKANEALNQQQKELKDWLSFDLELIEDNFIEMVHRAADKTWLDFRAFSQQFDSNNTYHSGEICSAGTLSCNNCGKHLHFKKTSHIPPCAGCHHSEFSRVIA